MRGEELEERTRWGLVIGVTVGFRGLKAAESSVRVGHTTEEKGSSCLANGSSVQLDETYNSRWIGSLYIFHSYLFFESISSLISIVIYPC